MVYIDIDLKIFAKHTKPQIEAGKMVNIVRETLKEAKHQKQDTYEKQRKSMEPLIEKLEDLKEEVAIAAQPPPERVAIEGVTPAALPAPTILVANPNYGFSEEELEKLNDYGLSSPLEAFHSGEESAAQKRAANINKNLGGQKRQTKKGSSKQEKLDAEINNLRKYQNRLKIIESGRATLVQQRGKGVVFYNTPEDLLGRLELLGGSIEVGNSSKAVARQFSAIAHKLKDLNVLSNPELTTILTNYNI